MTAWKLVLGRPLGDVRQELDPVHLVPREGHGVNQIHDLGLGNHVWCCHDPSLAGGCQDIDVVGKAELDLLQQVLSHQVSVVHVQVINLPASATAL